MEKTYEQMLEDKLTELERQVDELEKQVDELDKVKDRLLDDISNVPVGNIENAQ